MPFIDDKDLANLYDEVDKGKSAIDTLTTELEEETNQNSILKKHRYILAAFSLLFLILVVWSFLPKNVDINEEYLIKNNLSLINTDSLHELRREVDKIRIEESAVKSIKDLPLVYSVQIGAYTNFATNLFSDEFSHLSEFEDEGMSKFALGNFGTYKEAVQLRSDLKRMGFADCFIIAKSYGEPVNMKEALELTGEKWIRGN
ncbi:MAG: SPOR domain-containing protein [Bacteroidota bacterium]